MIRQDSPAVQPSGPERTYLAVPYAEKDDAKQLGARWDGAEKAWYVPAGVDLEAFTPWLPAKGSVHIAVDANPAEQFAEAIRACGLQLDGAAGDGRPASSRAGRRRQGPRAQRRLYRASRRPPGRVHPEPPDRRQAELEGQRTGGGPRARGTGRRLAAEVAQKRHDRAPGARAAGRTHRPAGRCPMGRRHARRRRIPTWPTRACSRTGCARTRTGV